MCRRPRVSFLLIRNHDSQMQRRAVRVQMCRSWEALGRNAGEYVANPTVNLPARPPYLRPPTCSRHHTTVNRTASPSPYLILGASGSSLAWPPRFAVSFPQRSPEPNDTPVLGSWAGNKVISVTRSTREKKESDEMKHWTRFAAGATKLAHELAGLPVFLRCRVVERSDLARP